MRITKYISILLIITSFGCQKELDLSPKDSLSSAEFWKTAEHFKMAANEFYGDLPGHTKGDERTDILINNNMNSISSGTNLIPANSSSFSSPYARIRKHNTLIKHAEGREEDLINRYAAEARFFRALDYFRLYSLYGDVPLIKKVLDVNSEELMGSRNSRTEVADFILSELAAVAEILPEEKDILKKERGRVSKGAALSLRARVALFEGSWAKFHQTGVDANKYFDIAIDASNKVIDSGNYDLFEYSSEPEKSYYHFFFEEGNDSKEQIFARRYADELELRHNNPSGFGGVGWSGNHAFMKSYLCSDGLPIDKSPLFQGYDMMDSEYKNRDPRMTMTWIPPLSNTVTPRNLEGVPFMPWITGSQSGYQIIKFVPQDKARLQDGKFYYFNHIIRYAEVLLILAEATFEKSGSVSDEILGKTINKLRKRAGFATTAYLTNSFVTSNSLDMRQEIRRERAVELALEGFRYDDIRRWKIAENVMPVDLLGVKFEGTQFETEYADVSHAQGLTYNNDGFIVIQPASKRHWEQKHYLMPIPSNQILLNNNLNQNPDWD